MRRGSGGRRNRAPSRRQLLLLFALVTCLATVSCGYTLVGRGAFIPGHIHSVAIPTFENRTSRFEVEVRITDAVTREFVSRGDFRVVSGEADADAVLRGEILSFVARPVGLRQSQEAQTFQVEIRAAVTFTDLVENEVLFTNSSFLFRDEFEFPEDPNALFDVEIGAVDEIAREFARSVVTSILEGF